MPVYSVQKRMSEWRKKLKPNERAELDRAFAAREASNDVYKAMLRKLKNRCESRMRAEKNGRD